ncbi:MAG: hypothetical protein K1X74_04280 [Pirellulales bacterium]|nr:hypothetical protein [Pirellulales bacterium]
MFDYPPILKPNKSKAPWIDPPGRWVARYILAAILGAAGGVCGLYRPFDEIGYPGCLYLGVPIGAIAGCAFGWFAGTAVDRRRNLRRLRFSIGELLITAPAIALGMAVLFECAWRLLHG